MRHRSTLTAATGALLLGAALAVPYSASSETWQGARLKHMERPLDPVVERDIQVPVLSYLPNTPQVDDFGRIWLHELSGYVRMLTPYVGETGHWQIPRGLESRTVGTADNRRLAVNRNGVMFAFNPEQPGGVTRIATGLPTIVGTPCRSGLNYFWSDARGGVSVTLADGELVARYQDELFGKRRIRGGGAVACHDQHALAAIAGGKLVGFADGALSWAEAPGVLAGASFAASSFYSDGRWYVCTRRKICFAVDAEEGVIVAATEFASFDGPMQHGDSIVIATTEGFVHKLDGDLVSQVSVFVENTPLWLLSLPTGQVLSHDIDGQKDKDVVWATSSSGHLYRIDFVEETAERVYTTPSGFSAGGLLLPDRTGVVTSNFGTTLVFQLR